jgi:hypothetical protein
MIGLPNPYLILGAIVVAIGLYFYGHHKGWDERDMEMQVEIAKKNGLRYVYIGNIPGHTRPIYSEHRSKNSGIRKAIRSSRIRGIGRGASLSGA